MKDVKEFLESKYSEYVASATSKQYIDRMYTATILSDDELCECIEDAPDWEVCEIYGLLDELAERAEIDFDYKSDHWESDIDKAIEVLSKAN
jgi:hypothetical protein